MEKLNNEKIVYLKKIFFLNRNFTTIYEKIIKNYRFY